MKDITQKLHANISYEYSRHKNPQCNASKQNSATYKKNKPWPYRIYSKNTNLV